jgi:hypothetical protein
LFNGAVQISWFENDIDLAHKAAEHFIFHGPEYHGLGKGISVAEQSRVIDTASFTLNVLESINNKSKEEPFNFAIAGYGTGKSHLGVTLATLLSEPQSEVSKNILRNIKLADSEIADSVSKLLGQPYLVVAINGMNNFDLIGELIRQILEAIKNNNLDTSVLENLKPRFKDAIRFVESFKDGIKLELKSQFGSDCRIEDIVYSLQVFDEEVYRKISDIYEQKMGRPLANVFQESLSDFLSVVKQNYCGNGKPFAGIIIIFDEFGRYMEFSVKQPHIAGAGALQQLFEGVQANSENLFLLSFIQYELPAYISRIAPELRNELNRYVTRFHSSKRHELSTNLETLIANLIEKKDIDKINEHINSMAYSTEQIHGLIQKWFARDIENHLLWQDLDQFERLICKGCWPLHPVSVWVLYKLASGGKTLQQRSVLSLLDDIISEYENKKVENGQAIVPAELCNKSLVKEFISAEESGQQGALAHGYEAAKLKYINEFNKADDLILKAVLIMAKSEINVTSKDEYLYAMSIFSGSDHDKVLSILQKLEGELAVLEWNESINRFDIAGDAVPKRAFISELNTRVKKVSSTERAEHFSQNFKRWFDIEEYKSDFGPNNKITTRDWHYNIYCTNVENIEGQVNYCLRSWKDALKVDNLKGQLLYCYLGPESDYESVIEKFKETVSDSFDELKIERELGAPLAVMFIKDEDGSFSEKVAEYWILTEEMPNEQETESKYKNFILDRTNIVKEELNNKFEQLKAERHFCFATESKLNSTKMSALLEELFDTVYKKRIPFPFDGFNTAGGNAAKDCQIFTKELFRGGLDKEWLTARSGDELNRGHNVLDKSWGIFTESGSVSLKPKNSILREIIEQIDAKLYEESGEPEEDLNFLPLNLGELIRELCAPPFGCNLSSAGMISAYFVGRRKKELNTYLDDKIISIENWLSEAFPNKSTAPLDLHILERTIIQKVSGKALSEWEVLLENWETELSLKGKVKFMQNAEVLNKRVVVPQQLYHRYALLRKDSEDARLRLKQVQRMINEANDKTEEGYEKNNLINLTWGAAGLTDVLNILKSDSDQWGTANNQKITDSIGKARLKVQEEYPAWLEKQSVRNYNDIGKFKNFMLNKVGSNLEKLDLKEEIELLKEHVKEVEENVKYFEAMNNLTQEINSTLLNNIITASTSIETLNDYLRQTDLLLNKLSEAKYWTHLINMDVEGNVKKLKEFEAKCNKQIEKYKERMMKLLDIDSISNQNDIDYWKNEVQALLLAFDNSGKDLEDLRFIQGYLNIIENHFNRLLADTLTDAKLMQECNNLMQECHDSFDGDPPLDNENIYESMLRTVRARRKKKADEWIQMNVPKLENIKEMDAIKATQIKSQLTYAPNLLSEEQMQTVRTSLIACDDRIDELDVEGLVAKFKALSKSAKKAFIESIKPLL